MGCAAACTGYELTANLDFDTNNTGATHTSGTGDSGDTYYNGGVGWTPIGVSSAGVAAVFTGTFDGNNHTISNLFINLNTSTASGGSFVGLFGDVSGAIRNVGLVNPYVANTRTGGGAFSRTAALAGRSAGGTVSRSYISGGSVTHTGSNASPIVGCLVGYAVSAISDSWASCAVTGTSTNSSGAVRIGGLVGWHQTVGTIANSYAAGAVTVTNSTASVNAGGLVGDLERDLISSYATGNVAVQSTNTTGNAGGLVGILSLADVKASYATGNVSATVTQHLGGLIANAGLGNSSVIAACYATGSVTRTDTNADANSEVGGLIGHLTVARAVAGSNVARVGVSACYATGAVSNMAANGKVGGLIGTDDGSSPTPFANSYWNTVTTGQNNAGENAGSSGATGRNTIQLQEPTGYSGIYANWNLDLDGQPGNDDPWDFGTREQYPVLKYNGRSLAWQGRGNLAFTRNNAPVTTLTVDEDDMGSASYGLALTTAPDADVEVTITSGDTALTIADAGTFGADLTLEFTAANWNTPQTLTIRGADDADVANLDTSLTLEFADADAGTPSGYGGVTRMVDATVVDDETAAITLSQTTLNISESSDNSTDATYTVRLSNEPAAGVTVTIAGGNAAVQVSSDGATFANSITLPFTAANYSTTQTVTVRAPDDTNPTNETVTLTHTATDAVMGSVSGYADVTARLTVNVNDDDIPNILLSSSGMVTVSEGTDASPAYTVRLTTAPTADVTVTLTAAGATIDGPDADSDFTASETLTFTSVTYATAQNIAIRTAADNDLAAGRATIAHRSTSTDANYHNLTAAATVTITNTETGSITLNPTALNFLEGSSGAYTVALAKQPAADATVTVSAGTTAINFSPSVLTFTRAGWSASQTQTVTVTAPANTGEYNNDQYGVSNTGGDAVSGSVSGYAGVSQPIQVSVQDTTAPPLTLTPSALTVTEGAGAGTYTVRLSTGSAAAVTVAIASNDPGRVTVSPDSLTFASGAPGPAQTVTVTPIEDGDNLNDALTLTHTPTIRGVVNPSTTLPVLVNEATDAATAAARITPPPAGTPTASYTLNTQAVTVTSNAGVPAGITISSKQALAADLDITLAAPAANVPARGGGFRLHAGSIVDITLSADPAGGLEVCLPRGRDAIMLLRYQGGTWVEVQGSQVRGDQVCAIITQFSVFGAGRRAGAELLRPADNIVFGEGRTAQITVLVQDTTIEDVQVSWAVSAPDGGATPADFGSTTPLDTFPTGSITIPAGSDQTGTIIIPIYDDDDAEGAEPFTVRLTQASGGVADYNDEAITARIALSDPSLDLQGPGDTPLTAASRLIITEGRTNAYTMALSDRPDGPVTVVIHSNHDGVTTSPTSLTFTPANFGQPQPVTVNAAPDGDAKNETATLTHILTDADGGLLEIIDRLPLFVADTDPPEDDDIC